VYLNCETLAVRVIEAVAANRAERLRMRLGPRGSEAALHPSRFRATVYECAEGREHRVLARAHVRYAVLAEAVTARRAARVNVVAHESAAICKERHEPVRCHACRRARIAELRPIPSHEL